VEPSARRALFAVAQVLPLEIPEEAKGRRGRTFRECDQCPELISIDPGVFLMGSRVSETYRYGREFPRRAVTVERRFALGRFAVTFDEWDACVSDGGCGGYKPADQGWGRGRQPVINVSWEDAQGYVGWLTTKTGRTYRLLSESEFEYAARAGSETAYPWGDQIGRNNANCRGCGSEWDDRQTAPVGSFGANAFGLYDMAGNVREWVQDCYHDNYYGAPTNSSAWRTGDCNRHIVRGGSWTRIQEDLRAASRDDSTASERRPDLGFRVGTTLVP
jgi:formylglycine-generating enzyme required for sulfatase activity